MKLAVAAQTDGPRTLAAYKTMWRELRGGEGPVKQPLTAADLQRAGGVLETLYAFVQETEDEAPWL